MVPTSSKEKTDTDDTVVEKLGPNALDDVEKGTQQTKTTTETTELVAVCFWQVFMGSFFILISSSHPEILQASTARRDKDEA